MSLLIYIIFILISVIPYLTFQSLFLIEKQIYLVYLCKNCVKIISLFLLQFKKLGKFFLFIFCIYSITHFLIILPTIHNNKLVVHHIATQYHSLDIFLLIVRSSVLPALLLHLLHSKYK